MPDENHASANSAPLRRSFWQRRVDALFGYDFFISYAWADGKTYAHDLAQRLTRRGFECFLDNRDYSLGDDWKVIGAWALKRTSKLVLVGTPKALQSEPVLLELQVFTSGGKRIIPIDFDGSLAFEKNPDNPVLKLIGPTKLKVGERAERLNDGPSDTAMKEIVATFNHTRQSVKRLRWIRRVAVLLLALFVAAVGFAFYAELQRREANRQKHEAVTQETKAKRTSVQADFDLAVMYQKQSDRVDPRTFAHLARALRTSKTQDCRGNTWFRCYATPLGLSPRRSQCAMRA